MNAETASPRELLVEMSRLVREHDCPGQLLQAEARGPRTIIRCLGCDRPLWPADYP